MSFEIGQQIGRLTVTQLKPGGVAVQVRCDCGATIGTRLEYDFLAPPDEIGPYHVEYLLAAEAGRLRYNFSAYRNHGVANNAYDALCCGLLVDAAAGPVLTDLGAHMLAHWKAAATAPPPFTPERAAWIREFAWTGAMRKTFTEVPGFYLTCACQGGLTHWCLIGRHDRCHRATPQRSEAGIIATRDGGVASFAEPYAHQSDVSATGPSRTRDAMVWLADRVCRWVCPCECHTAPARQAPAQLAFDLFAEVG